MHFLSFIAESLDKEVTYYRSFNFHSFVCVRACVCESEKENHKTGTLVTTRGLSTRSCFLAQPCKDLLSAWAITCLK